MQTNKLRRVLGFWDVFFIAVGQIIGAGVVALTGIAIGMTGPSVILAYFFAGILVLVVSIPIMIAGTSLPATGAYYTWSSRVGGGWLGSIVLLLILLATISLSLFGSSFGLYLNPIFPALSVNQWGLLIIVVLGCANLFGLQLASKVQMFLVLLLMSALAVYAGFAIPQLDTALLTPMFPKGIVGFITAVFLLKFATGGAYLVVGLSGEMMNPRRTVVVVMISATLAVVVIYGFVALASVGVIPWQEMINQPLTVAGRAFLPGWAMTYFLIAGAGLAICTTLNSQFIQLPRSFMVASWDKLLPEWVGGLNRYGAPYVIILGMLAVGAMPLIFGLDIGDIARAATISASFPAFIVFWVVTQIPKKYPEAYKLSVFQLSQGWMWALFLFSEFASVVGVYFLAQYLSTTVIVVLMLWITIAVAYYPLRKRYLASKGIDLDVLTTDEEIFRS
ncbi:APC family permease [Pseudomonadales bacterium]|nr:APC family permease [Pseudomonadales bacterium]